MLLPDFPAPRAAAPRLPLPGLSLRAAGAEDLGFVQLLQFALREDEFAEMPMPAEQKRIFFNSQIRMQHLHYTANYPQADFWIVEQAGNAIGLLYLDRSAPRWRLIDIILAADARGHGRGAGLIGWIKQQASAAGASIGLSVALNNPRAQALYRRLGFVETAPGEAAMLVEMTWPG